MKFISTKGNRNTVTLREALLGGVPADGGLYVPAYIPRIPIALFNNLDGVSLQDTGYIVANTLMGDEIDSGTLRTIVNEALDFEIPLKRVADRIFALELFHGPTLAFKDVGARMLAMYVKHVLGRDRKHLNVVVATAGDSGGAIANAFYGMEGVDVYVIYPLWKMSRVQEAQFTTLGKNIHPIGVNGDFDTCQRLVRQALLDDDLRSGGILSGNSMNIGRLMAQAIYYVHAYASLPPQERENTVVAVPSGNLGNLTAGIIALRMGLPVRRFVAAHNSNDAFAQYLKTGRYKPDLAVRTLATSMDVGAPSNFERLMTLYDFNHESISRDIVGYSCEDSQIAHTMNSEFEESGYQLDPHSAIAYSALQNTMGKDETGIFLATAHPAKFYETVETVTGHSPRFPEHLTEIMKAPRRTQRIAPNFSALKEHLLSSIRG